MSAGAFVFPAFIVHKNDLIVVHMNSTFATCNPNAATQETATVTDQPAATFAGNFDTAFDFWATDNGLTATVNVFTLSDAAGAFIDAVFAIDNTANNGRLDEQHLDLWRAQRRPGGVFLSLASKASSAGMP